MDPGIEITLGITLLLSLIAITILASAEIAFAAMADKDALDLKRNTKASERCKKLILRGQVFFMAIKGGIAVAYMFLFGSLTLFVSAHTETISSQTVPVLLIAFGLAAVVLFFIHEIIADRFVLDQNVRVAEALSLPLLIYTVCVTPLVKPLTMLLNFISKKFELGGNGLNHQKLIAMMENGDENKLEEDERAMIHSIIEFGDTEVCEVMVPRTDMVCVDETADLKTLATLIEEKGHSRIPLFSEDVDNILGIIHIKDLLPYSTGQKATEPTIKALARPAYFVPETKKLDLLLKEFQRHKHHMAIVVDEYGGTAGLVTLEDVIEEIVGDIQDEYDKEPPLVRKLDENVYLVRAKIDLHELNETLSLDLPTEGEYESLGGFILSLTGYVPAQNEVVEYKNYSFHVQEVDRNRIIEVKLIVADISTSETKEDKDSD